MFGGGGLVVVVEKVMFLFVWFVLIEKREILGASRKTQNTNKTTKNARTRYMYMIDTTMVACLLMLLCFRAQWRVEWRACM